MASLKVEKPVGTQSPAAGQAKKEPSKPNNGSTPKAPASKPAAPKKTEQKPQPKKKTSSSK